FYAGHAAGRLGYAAAGTWVDRARSGVSRCAEGAGTDRGRSGGRPRVAYAALCVDGISQEDVWTAGGDDCAVMDVCGRLRKRRANSDSFTGNSFTEPRPLVKLGGRYDGPFSSLRGRLKARSAYSGRPT